MRVSVAQEGLEGDARYELLTMELPDQVAMFVPLSFSESYMRMGWYVNK